MNDISITDMLNSETRRNEARNRIESDDYDRVTAEVLRMRFDDIVHDMGTTLKQTSGSPIITEANDFSTSILDADAGLTASGSYIIFHLASAHKCLESVHEEFQEDELHPGDAIILNDVYRGAPHKPDIGVLSPMFQDGKIINWFWSAAHMYDIGGISPGSFAPQVTDTYGEGFNIPPMKLARQGEINEDLKQLLQANSRLPERMFNDIRSFVATNNTGKERVQGVINTHGLAAYKLYSEIVGLLSERAFRERIQKLPDGTYSTTDWVEHDGHDHDLFRIECRMTVDDDTLHFDFEGTDPQAAGPINTGPGGLLGNVMSPISQMLLHDIQFNFGCMEPVDVDAPSGTIVNAEPPAATGYGHLDAGFKIGKMVTELLSHTLMMCEEESLQKRAMGQFNDSWSIESWGGTDQYERPFAWLNMDGGGFGGGAQTVVDGLDIAGDTCSVGNAIPDVEWKEQSYPALYLWRRLEPNSGGPGTFRGGRGLDFAWIMWGTPDEEFLGTVCMAEFNVPSRGFGGGVPGSVNRIRRYDETNISDLIADDRYPDFAAIEWEDIYEPEPKEAPVRLESGDMIRHFTGGGAGLGDPLLRDPEAVAQEVHVGLLDRSIASDTYGVVLDDANSVDESATASRRKQLRSMRLRTGGDTS